MMDFAQLIEAEAGSYTEGSWEGQLGGQDVKLYSKPVTSADIAYVQKKGYPEFPNVVSPGAMIEMIARKARDENGNKVFNIAVTKRMHLLLKASKVTEIAAGLFEDQFELDEDDEAFQARVEK